jgi:hypothetical protein
MVHLFVHFQENWPMCPSNGLIDYLFLIKLTEWSYFKSPYKGTMNLRYF